MTPRLPAAVVVLALVLAALGGRFYDSQPGREGFGPTENRDVVEAARRLGTLHAHDDFEHVHVFSYPPFTVLPFVPFTILPFRAAALLWQALSLGFLALSLWCLWRAVPLSPVGGGLLIALALLYEPLFLYSAFLLLAFTGLAAAWRGARRGEVVVTGVLFVGLWLVGASWQSQFADRASWSHGLGMRYMFPVVPLVAAFAGPALERLRPRALALVALPSLACGYLGAQAGFAPVSNALPYALKTWVSGTGMGVLFKEALPAWLGVDTLHTLVSRPDVTAADVARMLATPAGLALAAHQVLFLLLNGLVLAGIAWILRRLWREPLAVEAVACAS